MNKRARLTRRILREHSRRRQVNHHITRSHYAWWDFWACPHCPRQYKLIPLEAPLAYRERP